jgi:hypothetical protein
MNPTYKLLWAYSPIDLESLINTFLSSGWQLYGNTFVFGNMIVQPLQYVPPLPPPTTATTDPTTEAQP